MSGLELAVQLFASMGLFLLFRWAKNLRNN